MRTHPDAIGSTRLVKEFLEFSEYYEAAKSYLSRVQISTIDPFEQTMNPRLEFFKQLKKLEAIDTPYAYHRDFRQINPVKATAVEMFRNWGPRGIEFYNKADQEFDQIKGEKPEGPYLRKVLGLNLLPVFHNIVMFHLTGRMVYKRQVRQNLSAILDQLKKSGHMALEQYVEFLVADMEDGAAIFGDAADAVNDGHSAGNTDRKRIE